jgi:hypothetical protein
MGHPRLVAVLDPYFKQILGAPKGFQFLLHLPGEWRSIGVLIGLLALPPAVMAQQSPAAPSSNSKPAASVVENGRPASNSRRKRKAEKFYLEGLRAMEKGDGAAAEKAFARAAQEDPEDREYSADHEIAREHGITELIQSADKARIAGHPEAARAKLAEALALDPRNPEVAQHIDDLANLALTAPPADDATATIAPPIELAPLPGRRSFHLKGAEQDLLRQVFSAYGISAVFDSSISRQVIRFDADDVDFAHAAYLLGLATDSFLAPLDPKRVLVAKDTRENRDEYQRVAVETLRLPGLTATELTDMGNIARNVIGITKATVQANSETITARAPMPVLLALNRTFADLLEGRSEVLLDVRLFTIDKTRSRNIGLQLPQTYTLFNVPSELNSIIQQNQSLVQQIVSSGLASAGDTTAIVALLIASGQVSSSILNQPFALFGGGLTESGVSLSGVTANLALNSSDTRALDQIQLRLDDKEQGTIRSGVRYPIETSSYSSLSGSSVNIPGLNSAGLSSSLAGLGVNLNNLSTAQPVPQVQYQDLGLTLQVTPVIERTDDVSLKLDFKLTALQGTSLNGLPVLTNTSYSADVMVASGASAMLVSNMTRQQSNAVTGVPGLSELPGFQSATNSQAQFDVSNLVILVTPHLLRRRHSETVGPYIPLPRHGL